MNCSAKELNRISFPNGWTVRVIYRDGSLPTTFTIEELKDIEEQIDLRSDWIQRQQIRTKAAVGRGHVKSPVR
jgi:hypothetical protein